VPRGTTGGWRRAVSHYGFVSVGSGCLPPGIHDVFPHVVAAATNCWTENNVDIVCTRTKGCGHDRKGCANNIRDGSTPPGMGNTDDRTAAPDSRIDDQHRLTVGMQGHQHRAGLIRHQCVA
jgi:hypothetical protein